MQHTNMKYTNMKYTNMKYTNMQWVKFKKPELQEALRNGFKENLCEWLKTNAKDFFNEQNRATSEADFNLFKDLKTDRTHFCYSFEPMMIDRKVDEEHYFCICYVSKNNRITYQKPIVKVSELPYWNTGYWLIPDITKENAK